jgi:hypothetical protein
MSCRVRALLPPGLAVPTHTLPRLCTCTHGGRRLGWPSRPRARPRLPRRCAPGSHQAAHALSATCMREQPRLTLCKRLPGTEHDPAGAARQTCSPRPWVAAAARRGASWRRPRPPARRRAWSAPCGAPCATAPGWRALHAHSACVARGSPHVVLRASLPGVDMHLYAREVARREGVRVVLACGGRSVHVPTCPHASTEESVARL